MTFHVGMKVVCVSDACPELARENPQIVNWPVKDTVYTIRFVGADGSTIGCYVNEIVNPPCSTTCGHCEPGFTVEWFRPIVERKTDISIFKKMETPKVKQLETVSPSPTTTECRRVG